MGGGKKKGGTGIGFVDNAVNAASKAVSSAAKNVEKSVGSVLTETAYAVGTGDFNNYGNTVLNATAMGLTGGMSGAAGYKPGETGTERKVREEKQKALNQAEADKKATENAATAARAGTLRGIIEGRARSPGRAATLLNSSAGASLLTPKG